jgi:hypothetical protein
MFQVLAALFFTLALIAPLAVIILTLHQSWATIISALRGAPAPAQMVIRVSRSPRPAARVSSRPARLPLQPVRVAA